MVAVAPPNPDALTSRRRLGRLPRPVVTSPPERLDVQGPHDHTRCMLERLWLAAILLFIAGWAGVLAAPGSIGFGLVVYVATAGLVCLAVSALVRFAVRSFHA